MKKNIYILYFLLSIILADSNFKNVKILLCRRNALDRDSDRFWRILWDLVFREILS